MNSKVLIIDPKHPHYHEAGVWRYTEHNACGFKLVIALDAGGECWADAKQLDFLEEDESIDDLANKLFYGE